MMRSALPLLSSMPRTLARQKYNVTPMAKITENAALDTGSWCPAT
jgi:hypothetical protein